MKGSFYHTRKAELFGRTAALLSGSSEIQKSHCGSTCFHSVARYYFTKADRVLDQLLSYVSNYDIVGLREYWNFLDSRIFCRLEHVSIILCSI